MSSETQYTVMADFLSLHKVAGLAALLYDHCLTFGDEINLICTAPRSFLKWVFLTNHYLVEMCLIAVAIGALRCRVLFPRLLNHRLLEISGYSSVLRDNGVSISSTFTVKILTA